MGDDEIYEDGMYNPALNFPSTRWDKWFAWYPVVVRGERIWMKTVYRCRKIQITSGDRGMRQVWAYGNIFDVLSQ